MAAVVVATWSMNPRRVDVMISPSSFAMGSVDLTDAYFSGYETKADDGDVMKRVAIAADRRREAAMVDVDGASKLPPCFHFHSIPMMIFIEAVPYVERICTFPNSL